VHVFAHSAFGSVYLIVYEHVGANHMKCWCPVPSAMRQAALAALPELHSGQKAYRILISHSEVAVPRCIAYNVQQLVYCCF
jgi:hypothetical protein